MQKFLGIAEQYVEWVALGIGVLYLALMGWSYVYQPNINVSLGAKVVEPGDIDKFILNGPIKDLDEKIGSQAVVPITPPDVVDNWMKKFGDQSALVENWPGVFPGDPNGVTGLQNQIEEENPGFKKLASLPKIPAAVPAAVASYRTLVEFPDPNFDAANAAPGAAVPIIQKDIDAVSVEYKVDMKTLAKAFQVVFPTTAPAKVFQTMYLRVHLWREEQDANGKWGVATEIPALVINPLPPLPKDPVDEKTGWNYKAWAAANQDQILHPPFYQTAKGAPVWVLPEQANAAAAAAAAGAGAAPAPGPGAPPVFPGGPFAGGPPRPGMPASVPGGAPRYNPQLPGAGGPPYVSPGAPPFAGLDALSAGAFNPLQKVADDVIVAHDDTVQPDKTYRYYVQYTLLNPLFSSLRLAVDEVVKQFSMSSPNVEVAEAAAMSQAITIPSRTQIFVKSVQGGVAVHFAVFQWTPLIKETEIVATPGDTLAPSPYILVDIRSAPAHAWYVLLVNPDGKEMRRDLLKDKADPNFLQFEKDAANAAPAAALAN